MAKEYITKDREGDEIRFTHYSDGDVIITFTHKDTGKKVDMWFHPEQWEDFASIVQVING